jgi:hypothetical protein
MRKILILLGGTESMLLFMFVAGIVVGLIGGLIGGDWLDRRDVLSHKYEYWKDEQPEKRPTPPQPPPRSA